MEAPLSRDNDNEDDLVSLLARRREIDRALLEQHSRELVIFFTDMVGSTALFETRGDLAGFERVRRHNDLLFPVVTGHRGRIVKTLGDAIMAVFDDPLDGVRCAVACQQTLESTEWSTGEDPIRIRVGAHFGRALVAEDGDVFGDAVNTAARVVGKAGAGEVLLSKALAALLPKDAGLLLESRGSFQARGKAEPVSVVEVVWRPTGSEQRAEPDREPSREQLFMLELGRTAKGLKLAAADGDGDRGTVKSWAEVELTDERLATLSAGFDPFMREGGSPSYLQRVCERGAELFEAALPQRVREKLGATRTKHLRLHVDAELVHVPWELLHDGTTFLGCRFSVGRVVNARAEAVAQRIRSTQPLGVGTALVVSNAGGGLEAAVREGEAVAGLLREGQAGEVRHLVGPVTRASFLDALQGCALLHFAGHAELRTHASTGGFVLADGLVTPQELAEAVGTSAPPLVFANTCHGSRAEGFRGTHDLASALLLHGTGHFIGPRWEISDGDALAFALRFYELALRGEPLGEAVRQARVELEAHGERPLSFAGYVLYGEPRDRFAAAGLRKGQSRAVTVRSSRTNSQELPVMQPAAAVPAPVPSRARPTRSFGTAAAISVVAVVSVVSVGGYLALQRPEASPVPPEVTGTVEVEKRAAPSGPVRLCVLPFRNIGGEAELSFMSEGIAESVLTDFGQRPGIRIIERVQIELDQRELEFSNSEWVDPQTRAELGKIQGAEVVVLGGFQRSGRTVRAHARYVEVETGEVLQSVRAEGSADALFELQDAVAAAVREALPEVQRRLRPDAPVVAAPAVP